MLPSYLVHSEDVLHTKRVRVVITFVVLNRIELPSVGQTVGTPEDNSAVQRGSCEHAVWGKNKLNMCLYHSLVGLRTLLYIEI